MVSLNSVILEEINNEIDNHKQKLNRLSESYIHICEMKESVEERISTEKQTIEKLEDRRRKLNLKKTLV